MRSRSLADDHRSHGPDKLQQQLLQGQVPREHVQNRELSLVTQKFTYEQDCAKECRLMPGRTGAWANQHFSAQESRLN